MKASRSLLFLGGSLDLDDLNLDDGLLDGDRKSLSILTGLPHGVAGGSADVSVLMVSHEPTGSLVGLLLELDDLAGGVNLEVLKGGLGSLLVDVLDLLWLGVDLLLSLSLTTIKVVVDDDVGLGGDASLVEGGGVVEDGGTVHEVVAFVAGQFFNLVFDVSNDVATFDIKSELLAARGGDKELSLHTNYILI